MVPTVVSFTAFFLAACSSSVLRRNQELMLRIRGQPGLFRKMIRLGKAKRRFQTIMEMGSRQNNQCVQNLLKERDVSLGHSNWTFRPPSLCKSEFQVHFMKREPYSNVNFKVLLNQTLQQCCGKDNVMQIKQTMSLADADFVYPVFGDSRSELVYGYYFVPLIHPPGVFYITPKKHFDLSHVIAQCLELWPLLVTCISLAFVAGFIVWLLETRRNKKHFPRSFFRGWFKGVWFSFVFMTPVGFGNTAPKSIPGRLFSVVSILVGMFVFEILAAELTTIILQANTVAEPSMAGVKVGVMNDRFYDSTIVTNNGGIPVEAKDLNLTELIKRIEINRNNRNKRNIEFEEFYKLVSALQRGHLGGIAIDKHSYRNIRKDFLRWNQTHRYDHDIETIQFFLVNTIATDIPHSGGDGAYGLLMKKQFHYNFFGPVFESSKLLFQKTLSKELQDSSDGIVVDTNRNIYSNVFYEKLKFVCIAIGSIVCFGVIYQVRRRKRKVRRRRKKGNLDAVAI